MHQSSSKIRTASSLEDPVPGPSNSAADFDLEVFDSGSSCSLEECCWRSENKLLEEEEERMSSSSSSSGHAHALPSTQPHPPIPPLHSRPDSGSCLSETDEEDGEGETRQDEADHPRDEEPVSDSSPIHDSEEDPSQGIPNEIQEEEEEDEDDVYHDNFGTHENEDSLDAASNVSHCHNNSCNNHSASSTSTISTSLLLSSHKRKSGDIDSRPIADSLQIEEKKLNLLHVERLHALDNLIETCDPTQVRHMMQVIEPQFQRDFISLLPKELALYVLSFLDPRDLLRAAQTCRYWRILAEDNLLWREKCREAGLKDVRDMMNKRRKLSSGFVHSACKTSYMRQHNIEMNWRIRPIRPPKVLKGHDDHVITCLQFSNNRIVSGSDDNTLKVWSATTGKCLRTLVGHTGGVWSSQMRDNIIVSGSTDRSLKVWNADAGTCVHTLYGHTSTVRCMHLHENQVVSGSRDSTLRIWDIETGECLHILAGHLAAVRCVQYDGRLVVSGAYDYMVKVWNPEREECLHTLSGHTNRVYSLQFDGIHVVSGSLDTSIRVWDVETGALSGNADSTVKVWDITNGQCLQTLSGHNKHQSAVTCLQFNSKFVITSSDDGTVKLIRVFMLLFHFVLGEFVRDLVALESGGSGGVVWRIRANPTKLVCAVGSRNGTEETKLLVLDFDVNELK
ncbi:FBXW7 [Lepeophtheirus salmonis]|uniref:FBXW7 n=1 Tax=Lepeophtheirus salmonis TaxID=72036 RepID=A0A7R8CUN9_LEPSM|nr:FBXW7 [Lepeophtheirus salmonis]CAF2901812.1 FBXW7 [Lepeophtheirus salmonis]